MLWLLWISNQLSQLHLLLFQIMSQMSKKILAFITPESRLKRLVIGLESTSFYGVHIANYLSTCHELMTFHTEVYCLNPKRIANY